MFCIICSAELKSGKRCCSGICAAEVKYRAYISDWLEGNNDGLKDRKTYQLSNHVRKYMLSKTNCSCQECGWNKTHPIDGRPLVEIDHIDENKQNNNPSNLRLATEGQNHMNVKLRKDNTSGIKGVRLYPHMKKEAWTGQITANKKKIKAYFNTKEEAAEWVAAKRLVLS